MPVPTKTRSVDPSRGILPVGETRSIDISGLARGLGQFAQGNQAKALKANALLEKAKQQQDKIWADENYARTQKELILFMNEAQMNPSITATEDFHKMWAEKVTEVTGRAPTEEARERFLERSQALEVQGFSAALGLQTTAQTAQAVKGYTSQIDDLNEAIVVNRDPNFLFETQAAISASIDDSVGSVFDEATGDKLKGNLDKVILGAVDLWTVEDPALAKETLARAEGIPSRDRAMYERRIKSALEQNTSVNKALLTKRQNNYIELVSRSGLRAAGNYNVLPDVSYLPESKQQAAINEFNLKVRIANSSYTFSQTISGLSPAAAMAEAERLKPKGEPPENAPDLLEWRLYDQARQLASIHAGKVEEDAFGVAVNSASISSDYELYQSLPDDDPNKATAWGDVVESSIALQQSWGLTSGQIKYASQGYLEGLAETINTGSTQEIIDGLNSAKSLYGDYYPDVIRNLQELPNNAGVSPHLSVIVDQINGDNTPAAIHNYIKFNSLPTTELGVSTSEFNDLVESVSANTTVEALKDTLLATTRSTAINEASDIITGLAKYHAGRVGIAGKQDLKKDVEDIIGKSWHFGEANGRSFAIPKTAKIGGSAITPQVVKKMSYILDKTLDIPSPRGNTALEKSGLISFIATDEGAKANGYLSSPTEDDVYDSIRQNGYWVESEGGMMLMASTGDLQARPVIGKDGPVVLPYEEAMKLWDLDFVERKRKYPEGYRKYW